MAFPAYPASYRWDVALNRERRPIRCKFPIDVGTYTEALDPLDRIRTSSPLSKAGR